MRKHFSLLMLVLGLLAVAPAHGQQCTTAAPALCEGGAGRCSLKFPFVHSRLLFEASGTCTVNVTACLVTKSSLDLLALDVEANQSSTTNPPANRIIQTAGQPCLSTGNKVVVYDITHTGCTDVEIFIFCEIANFNVSPRICQCSDVSQCQRGRELATAGVNGFWPAGTIDPISRQPGGTSDFWWCNEVPDPANTAVFGGYLFEPLTEIKVGSNFPIKFRLFDEFGNVIPDANVLLSIEQTALFDEFGNVVPCDGFCPVIPLVDPGASEAGNPNPLYGFDGNHYKFNWKPETPGVYNITSTFLNYFVPQQTITIVVVP